MFETILHDEIGGELIALVSFEGRYSVRTVNKETNTPIIIKESKDLDELKQVYYKEAKKMNNLMNKNERKRNNKNKKS